MADQPSPQSPPKAKARRKPFLVPAILLAIAAGAVGFASAFKGLVPGLTHAPPASSAQSSLQAPEIAFVPIDTVVIPLGPAGGHEMLRLTAQLEVPKAAAPDVSVVMPRILDVINTYLRAVEISELEDRAALVRIRAHLLRRIRIVVGEDVVRDLLITEFLLN